MNILPIVVIGGMLMVAAFVLLAVAEDAPEISNEDEDDE